MDVEISKKSISFFFFCFAKGDPRLDQDLHIFLFLKTFEYHAALFT